MQLGAAAQIAMGVNDVSKSFEFFKNIGFKLVEEAENPFDWIKLSDGNILVFLTHEGISHTSIVYLTDNLEEKVDIMDELGVDFIQRTEHEGKLEQVLFLDPENTLVVSMFQRDTSNFPKPEGQSNEICGDFSGVAYPVMDLDKAVDFWQKLGFDIIGETEFPYRCTRMSDGVMPIEIHETESFDKPSISYSSPDASQRLAALQMGPLANTITFSEKGGGKLTTIEGQSILFLNVSNRP